MYRFYYKSAIQANADCRSATRPNALVNPICRIEFRGGQVRHDIDALEKVAGQLFEVFDLTDPIHLRDDAVEHRLDFFERFFRKERPLVFEPVLVPEEFLSVEI